MSRRALYVATGLFLFVLFTLANLPLATVLDWADARQRGLAWQTAGGTVWAGEIGNATYDAYPVGNIRVKTFFLPLLAGRLSVEASIAGPGLAVAGRLSLAPGNRLVLEDTAALIDLQQYNIFSTIWRKF